jgi:D-glycero-D-manno-heptose 1,7-bisphosphate phosphatase
MARRKVAVFLDRDGVINVDKDYVYKMEDFELFPWTIDALKLLQKEYYLFITTNQSGIGRGYYGLDDFRRLNEHMMHMFKKEGIVIKKTYFCPHIAADDCDCRKPSPKFLKQAEEEFSIDLQHSVVIGDKPHDIEFGHNGGCRTIYVLTGKGKKHLNDLNIQPEYVAENLLAAAQYILRG